jgi:hypothetical protein
MIFPDADPKKWALRYDVEISTGPCVVCRRLRTANIPFIEQEWAGFISLPCKCGLSGDSFSVQAPLKGQLSSIVVEDSLASVFIKHGVDAKKGGKK